jgi:hypothetical protein
LVPHAADSDAACTISVGHFVRKNAVFVLVCFATKPDGIENNICKGTGWLNVTLSSGITSLQLMVVCKRCELVEQ